MWNEMLRNCEYKIHSFAAEGKPDELRCSKKVPELKKLTGGGEGNGIQEEKSRKPQGTDKHVYFVHFVDFVCFVGEKRVHSVRPLRSSDTKRASGFRLQASGRKQMMAKKGFGGRDSGARDQECKGGEEELQGTNAVSYGGLNGEDAAGSRGQVLQQFDDIVIRGKQVISDSLVISRGCSFVPADAQVFHGIHSRGVGTEPGFYAQIAEIFNRIIIGNEQAACDLPAFICRYTSNPADIYFFFRFKNIDIASLLKRLQNPVNTFGIAVCQETLETLCIGPFVKYQRFTANMTVCPRRYAAKRIDDH